MASSFEKSVKGGTKVKLAPPKSKYVEHILLATQSGEAGVAEVFRTLTHRLRDSTWTVAFKSLIVVHLMIKEGTPDVTLSYLSAAPTHRLAINSFTDVQTQGHNIRRYSDYLLARAKAYAVGHCDYVASGQEHMKRLSIDKGLLRETEVVQDQIRALVKANLLDNDAENEISLTAFRLLTRDLLDLYNTENEAMMNVLSHYFEMSKPDAERAIKIYSRFCKQTDQVVQFLGVARQYEHATRLEIPRIKHAPTGLAASLQEYLDDKDFDVNRRQYLAEQEARKTGKPFSKLAAQPKSKTPAVSQPAQSSAAPAVSQPAAQPQDLIDFFGSIEQEQQPMAQNTQQFQPQQNGFPSAQPTGFDASQQGFQQPTQGFPQQHMFQQQQQPQPSGMNGFTQTGQSTNPFGLPQQQQQPPPQQQQAPQTQPVQSHFTGAGFGGYGPQPQQQFVTGRGFDPQQAFGSPPLPQPQQQQQAPASNPFRASMMPTGGDFGGSDSQVNLNRQSTNPFARHSPSPFQGQSIPENGASQGFQQSPPPFAQQPQPQQTGFLRPMSAQPTGTNPFARPQQPQQTASPLQVQPTGSTNPFRQSMFVNQQTGQGWQNSQQATMGGFEQLETMPVFPRPGQQAQPQQQSPWG